MEAKEFTAKTVEEAVEAGLKEMGLARENAQIEVLEEPTGGFLGIGAKKARVKITPKLSDEQRANEFVGGLLKLLGITAATETKKDEKGGTVIEVITTNSSAVIGYRGEVLDALQCLASAVANTGKEEYSRLVVDCEGYRAKREETLKNLAQKLAVKAVRTGRKVTLEPMNPFERRIIHSTLADNDEVKTLSEGKEPYRYIAIIPNNLRSSRPLRDERRGGRDRDRGFDRRGRGDRDNKYDRRGRSERPSTSGFTSAAARPKKSLFGGTYLGNSLKDKKGEE